MTLTAKRIIHIVIAAVIATVAILIFSWFNVRGAEFYFLEDLPSDCTVKVTRRFWDGTTAEAEEREFILDEQQCSQLLDLIRTSSYWRDPSSAITHHEQTNYDIFITFEADPRTQYISVNSSGGYAFYLRSSLDTPFEDNFYRIRNKEWVAALEAILVA